MKTSRVLKDQSVLFAFLFALVMLLPSCERKQNDATVAPDLNLNENFAVFKTYSEFQETASKLSKGTQSELIEFEKKHNFVSLTTLFRKAEQEEAANHEREIKMISQQPQLEKTMKHEVSKTIQDNPESFIYSAEEGVQLNLTLLDLSKVLNKDGLVCVEGRIIQYKRDFIKIITDGDSRKIRLLDRTKVTDKQQNIVVNPIVFTNAANAKNGKVVYNFTRSCESFVGGSPLKWRILVYEEAFNADDPLFRYYYGRYRILTLKRGAFGSWQSYSTHSQRGTVNHFTPQSSIFVPPSLFDQSFFEATGSKAWSNASGPQQSTWIVPYFFQAAYLYNANSSPLSQYTISFSPSNTATFNFDVETFCECSIL